MDIPFLDLDAQYSQIKEKIGKKIIEVIESKKFIQGPYVEEFCNHFLKVHGGNFACGCSNGTSAISVALRSLKIGQGDEVITVTNTFIATVEAIAEVGAKIVLADCRADTYGLDLNQVEKLITPNTKAIIPVHLYGNPVEMDRLQTIAKTHNLKIIEDCAQAHLATYESQVVGSFGDFGSFSFYPGKNLGAYGDAGLLIGRDSDSFKLAKMYIDHGRNKKYEHEFLAGNFRMDGIQAAILNIKLEFIDEWTNQRINLAKRYDDFLKEKGFKVIESHSNSKCVYHLYIVEVSNREEVMTALKSENISCGIHYPIPLHLQPALKALDHSKGDFPESERLADRIISLPIFPEMNKEKQNFVIEQFLKIAKK